jgi:hypothetical protein
LGGELATRISHAVDDSARWPNASKHRSSALDYGEARETVGAGARRHRSVQEFLGLEFPMQSETDDYLRLLVRALPDSAEAAHYLSATIVLVVQNAKAALWDGEPDGWPTAHWLRAVPQKA